MGMVFRNARPVQLSRRLVSLDGWGESAITFADPIEVLSPGWWLSDEPSPSLEDETRKAYKLQVILPVATDVQPGDRLRVGEHDYLVEQVQNYEANPFGWSPGWVIVVGDCVE